jgi:hypothetical protein
MPPLKSLVGNVYGRLTVIGFAGIKGDKEHKNQRSLWLCKCSCSAGNEVIVAGNNLQSGTTKSCGCLHIGSRVKDLTNMLFGRLTVLCLDSIKRGKSYWLCECSCPEHTRVVVCASNLTRNHTTSCGCVKTEWKNRLEKDGASFNGLISDYKGNAKRRGYIYNLNNEDFKVLTQKPCTYCGAEPSGIKIKGTRGFYIYNGIDRVDSTLGYELSNVVPCCWICNRCKSNFSVIDFLSHVEKIYTHGVENHNNSIMKGVEYERYFNKSKFVFQKVYTDRQQEAYSRNYVFELNKRDFCNFILQPCHYCGEGFSHTKRFYKKDYYYNGIDRVDNNKGYTLDNCVPCCRWCNRAKSDMPQDEFLYWVNRVYNFSIKKRFDTVSYVATNVRGSGTVPEDWDKELKE